MYFFSYTGQDDTLGFNRESPNQHKCASSKKFLCYNLDEAHKIKHVHPSSVPHQRENTLAVGCANANPCVLGPGRERLRAAAPGAGL